MSHEINGKPIFSTSEEVAFKTCQLGHYFEYVLGYRPAVTNRKLSLGTHVHAGLEVWYKDGCALDIENRLAELAEERWTEITQAGYGQDKEVRADWLKDQKLAKSMVDGYIAWIIETGLDDAYETVAVEVHHYVEVPRSEEHTSELQSR